VEDLKRTLEIDQVITLPNHYEAAAAAVNQGVPVERIAPNSTIARSLRELADNIAPAATARPATAGCRTVPRSTAIEQRDDETTRGLP
jgi:pilus assembly protein CpaE